MLRQAESIVKEISHYKDDVNLTLFQTSNTQISVQSWNFFFASGAFLFYYVN